MQTIAWSFSQVPASKFLLVGSAAGSPWIIQLGFLNVLPMLVERKLEQTYLTWTDILLSVPFFAHQNRITSAYFRLALATQRAAYLASGRGLGNTHTSLLEVFLLHASSNFVAGGKLIVLVMYYTALGGDVLFLLWSLIAGVSYLAAPIFYNPKPTLKHVIEGFKELLHWISAADDCFNARAHETINRAEGMLTLEQKTQVQQTGPFSLGNSGFRLRGGGGSGKGLN